MALEPQATSQQTPHRPWIKIALISVIVVFVALIIIRTVINYMTSQALSHLPEPVNPVTVQQLSPQDWTPVLQSSGTIRPNQGVMLKSQMSGVVADIFVKAGQMVKKGEVLVSLDNRVEKAQLLASQAQLPSVRETYESYVKLFKSQSVSKNELEKAKSAYNALIANIQALEATIARRQIVAPFSGMAGIVKVNVGQFIHVGDEIVRVEDRSQMRVDFGIAQTDLPKLHLGQRVSATTDIYHQPFEATVNAIDPAVNAETGLVDMQALFSPTADQSLLSGMFVRLDLHLNTAKDQFVVPQIAINYNMYGDFLYLLIPLSQEEKDKLLENKNFKYASQLNDIYRVKQTPVNVLDRQEVFAQLTKDGLNFGDKFVVGGMQRLSNNSLVRVIEKPLVGTTKPETLSHL